MWRDFTTDGTTTCTTSASEFRRVVVVILFPDSPRPPSQHSLRCSVIFNRNEFPPSINSRTSKRHAPSRHFQVHSPLHTSCDHQMPRICRGLQPSAQIRGPRVWQDHH